MEGLSEVLAEEAVSKLRIAVDARSLNREHLRGIGKVLTKIVEYSPSDVEWTLYSDRLDLPFHLPRHTNCQSSIFECKGYRFNTWEQWALPRRLKRSGVDMLLSPANSAPLWQPKPTVAIIHDTIPWKSNWSTESSGTGWFHHRVLPSAFKRAAAVTTISQASADDIAELWPFLANRVMTIPNGVDDDFLGSSTVTKSVSPYFIYFGGSIPRKRLLWAVEAFRVANLSNCELRICGLESSKRDEFQNGLPPEIRERIKVLSYVQESEMPAMIQNSLGVIYPTLYEGFGLPALESQACGTACLLSPVSSLQELIGPGTLVLPTDDIQAWANAIRDLAASNGLSEATATAARTWARQFHWKEAAKKYMALFRQVVENCVPRMEIGS